MADSGGPSPAELNALGLHCKAAARYVEGRVHYRRALAILLREEPPDWDALATLYHNLGGIEHALGNYAAGEALARTGLAIREHLGTADPVELAGDRAALAALLDGQGKDAEAERLYHHALRTWARSGRSEPGDVAAALNNLGVLCARRTEWDQAAALLSRAAALKRVALGPDHQDLALTLNNLAVVFRSAGALGRAAAQYRHALQIFERTLGPDHPRTRICRANARRCSRAASGKEAAGELTRAEARRDPDALSALPARWSCR